MWIDRMVGECRYDCGVKFEESSETIEFIGDMPGEPPVYWTKAAGVIEGVA